MPRNRFVTAVCCMDGRIQEPVIHWMTGRLAADYVDMITEAGPVSMLASNDPAATESIRDRLQVSIGAHGSQAIAVVGHGDCAGNPVDDETHHQHIRQAAVAIQTWYPDLRILGLWVSLRGTIEVLADSDGVLS